MFILVFFVVLFAQLGWARPPEDLILLPPAKEKGVRVLRNKNITFTNEQPDPAQQAQVKTLFPVKGRSRPDRSGKVMSVLAAGSAVVPFRRSRDHKWIAVVVKTSGIRVWIPQTSLPKNVLGKADAKGQKSASSEGSTGADADE